MTPTHPSSTPATHWSHKAIACGVFAITGFFTLWLAVGLFLSAAGALFGHLARYDTAGGRLKGRKFATFGLVLSYVSMLSFPVLVLIVAIALPAYDQWSTGRSAGQRQESLSQAESLFAACEDFARANGDRYPPQWQDLSGRFLPGHELRSLLQSPYRGGGDEAFRLVRHGRPVLPATADTTIVIEEIAPPQVPQIAVVYADGTVKFLHNPAYELP